MSVGKNIQPWIHSLWLDNLFIIGPAFWSVGLIILLGQFTDLDVDIAPFQWLILVMCIDVAHVYSTVYRTYADPIAFKNRKNLFLLTPFFCWIAGVMLYSLSDLYFWRIMAYLAVFHFIKQQYGFMRIYVRGTAVDPFTQKLNTIIIYAATLYPMLVWHLKGSQNITWFVQGDFLLIHQHWPIPLITALYAMLITIYYINEFVRYRRTNTFNLPKNLLILGTGLSWYIAIVYYDSDLVFTLINIVSHGVPYLSLVWIYGNKEKQVKTFTKFQQVVFSPKGIIIFIGFILVLALIEEGLWDTLVWRDHPMFFNSLYILPHISQNTILSFIVPLLSVPQLTHYILDGFIWKRNNKETPDTNSSLVAE